MWFLSTRKALENGFVLATLIIPRIQNEDFRGFPEISTSY